jgi:hypothetical protein
MALRQAGNGKIRSNNSSRHGVGCIKTQTTVVARWAKLTLPPSWKGTRMADQVVLKTAEAENLRGDER